jgi:hypothetical protein
LKREMRLGENRGKPRLWLEGAVLRENGFLRGNPFVLTITERQITIERGVMAGLTLTAARHHSQRHVSGKTRNGADHPIIDINGDLLDPFADQDLLLVATPGSIVIRPAK